MEKVNVINYHITNTCNYNCKYCFGKFIGQKNPSLADAMKVIDNIASYFKQKNITNGRINFAGGEPTLYEHLDKLIDYTNSLGIQVSIVTNGSLLTSERIRSWENKVSCIGISIDSIENNTNLKIGRCHKNVTINLSQLLELAQTIHECNINLKINIVVSKLNINENFSGVLKALNPQKIKFLIIHIINGINEDAKPFKISDDEFENFCNNNQVDGPIIIREPYGSMENSYLMINPEGELQINNKGLYQTMGDLKTTSLTEILETVPFDATKFNSRYTKENTK